MDRCAFFHGGCVTFSIGSHLPNYVYHYAPLVQCFGVQCMLTVWVFPRPFEVKKPRRHHCRETHLIMKPVVSFPEPFRSLRLSVEPPVECISLGPGLSQRVFNIYACLVWVQLMLLKMAEDGCGSVLTLLVSLPPLSPSTEFPPILLSPHPIGLFSTGKCPP